MQLKDKLHALLMMPTEPDYSLPAWFQETTYIANSLDGGTIPNLRINLDYYPTDNTVLYMTMRRLGNSDGFPFYTGKTIDGTNFYYGINLYNEYPYPRFSSARGTYSSSFTMDSRPDYDIQFNDLSDKGALKGKLADASTWNLVNYTARSNIPFQLPTPLYLFALAGGSYPSRMRLYSNLKIEENGKLAVWLATGYNKNDTSEVGVYDRVRRRFILPEGTGTMYKGSDVT